MVRLLMDGKRREPARIKAMNEAICSTPLGISPEKQSTLWPEISTMLDMKSRVV